MAFRAFKLPLPLATEAVLGYKIPFIDAWWKKTTNKEFAPANYQSDLKNVNIPALMISGWWDGDGIGTKLNWQYMRDLNKPNQYLIYGPWTHLFNTTSKMGDVEYGSQAIMDLNTVYLRWFDTWLKDKKVLGPVPKVQVFVTGENKWRTLSDWPPKDAPERVLYFAASRKLSDKKVNDSKPDQYVYHPSKQKIKPELAKINPEGGSVVIKIDPKSKEGLFYETAKLSAPVTIGGPISVDLCFKTDVVDTDFFISIIDTDEKGVHRIIGLPGKLRAQYRKSMDKPELLKPGHNYTVTLDHWDVAHQFGKGHTIGVVVTSVAFPGYARNLNTGEPVATGKRMVTANISVFHDTKRPSALRFRVLK